MFEWIFGKRNINENDINILGGKIKKLSRKEKVIMDKFENMPGFESPLTDTKEIEDIYKNIFSKLPKDEKDRMYEEVLKDK